ncbi:hypothetical protein DWB85_17165 [Seongchinamella sediminis]|uniref:Uncharacterized protein n=2 Tax=Halieaceae TaxID=1706372 RepID=A0A2N5X607_9GAMM|nr:hypothetical protein [Pseudohalioglobus lutimaris]PLW69908.1 hypothetical protein C0039_05105 [Pseudohalioglobus lutimaris]RLQ20550.1 hypothetical protein DWB85_17165 [Seongchinamella sediminis]
MLQFLCRKSISGDIDVNLAMRHLASHEWGRARVILERALAKGRLSEPEQARILLQEARDRLGVRGA